MGYSPWGPKESDTTEPLSLKGGYQQSYRTLKLVSMLLMPKKIYDGNFNLVAQTIKNLLAMQETWVRSLGRKDPLEKGMATHSNILAQGIPWTEEPDMLQFMGSQRVRHD